MAGVSVKGLCYRVTARPPGQASFCLLCPVALCSQTACSTGLWPLKAGLVMALICLPGSCVPCSGWHGLRLRAWRPPWGPCCRCARLCRTQARSTWPACCSWSWVKLPGTQRLGQGQVGGVPGQGCVCVCVCVRCVGVQARAWTRKHTCVSCVPA